ncbi:Beta-glucosidase 17-like protein [Drosera capensis]
MGSINIVKGFLIFIFMADRLAAPPLPDSSLSRESFPKGFLFGAASSAYQYEGAASEDGKGPSIWDVYTKDYPEKIADHSNGDIASDFYHRYKDDVKLIKEIGLDTFRFSISWARILPKGKISGGINKSGIDFYNNLINELLACGIQPFVTLFHWDVPEALEAEYGGFLSSKVLEDYLNYVDLCFKEFGDRVKYWLTLNEPNYFSQYGYGYGKDAPGRCSDYIGNCTSGNSAIEPYQAAHNLILSHASAYHLYKQRYQASQKGVIGITLASNWYVPYNKSTANQQAASRAFDFIVGWILDPITFGDYPEIMRSIVGSRLPKFTKEESSKLKKSYDFVGLNYYTTYYAIDEQSSSTTDLSYTTDSHVRLTQVKHGVPIGEPTEVDWICIYPKGIQYLVRHLKLKYDDPAIIITENGVGDSNKKPMAVELKDYLRVRYHELHLAYLLKAINEGVNVKGYLVWSLFDDFEWYDGYIYRFGLVFIDFNNGLTRYKKYSAVWFKEFLRQKSDSADLLHSSS